MRSLARGPPFSYEIEAPDLWAQMPQDRRERRGELDSEICVIDDEHFFIKGNLWIPVLDGDQEFNWTVWVSVGKADFDRSIELWEAPNRELEPAYGCSLANELSLYPGSLGLEAQLITLGVGERPSIQLEPTEHPLAVEQREGIPLKRVQQIAELMLHC